MLKRELQLPPEHLYPVDPWRIIEARFDERFFARAETVFALSNGYVGVRGTFEEGRPAVAPGTFVNGFHETWPIAHAEEAFGLARTGQTMVNVPDASIFRVYVDDEPLFVPTAHLREYSRVLDMRNGTLTRDLLWRTPAGKHVRVRSGRLVSFEHRHILAAWLEVVLEDEAAPVVIVSEVAAREQVAQARAQRGEGDPRKAHLDGQVLKAKVVSECGDRLLFGYQTLNSHMTLGLGVQHVLESAADAQTEPQVAANRLGGEIAYSLAAEPGVPIRLTKYVAYQSSRYAPAEELVTRCERTLDRVAVGGFDELARAQRRHLDNFWSRADVRIGHGELTDRMQQAIRWNLYQVAQATWRAEGASVPAKGLTGQAYEGHYFWDTEVFVVPMLAYTQPRIARNLLRFRHSMLPAARRRARELGEDGALFPWRTINGEEASAYYQAGTAQYHINADIAHAIQRYVRIRGDESFLHEVGAEILVETARLWTSLGFHADDGHFHIHGVTGPDEYTTVVNDNAYTNLMARCNLEYAAKVVRGMARENPETYGALVADMGLGADEVAGWEAAAAVMYVPFDERRGIHPQDASFLDREVWDLEATPSEKFPLLLHFHPLVIYRHQVIKQADIVLASLQLGDQFSEEAKRADFLYYDPLTTGDSSLAAAVQSIVAAEIGEEKMARDYFRFAMLMDLADLGGNASDGVHIASAAGVWQALVFGFGGVRDFGGGLSITPHLPSTWDSLEFDLRFCDRQVAVRVTHDEERVELREGAPLEIETTAGPRTVSVEDPVVIAVRRAPLAAPSS